MIGELKNRSEFSPESRRSLRRPRSSRRLHCPSGHRRRPAENEVVAFTGKYFDDIGAGHQEVLAAVAEQQTVAMTVLMTSLPLLPRRKFVAEWIFDDVVAVAAEHLVGFRCRRSGSRRRHHPTACRCPCRRQPVVAFRAAEHDMLAADELEDVAIDLAVAVARRRAVDSHDASGQWPAGTDRPRSDRRCRCRDCSVRPAYRVRE